ncbi:hypothetical protein [Agromyces aerolatus]|uniref:hypothetical protein n=1 Tax=Agromyces sp. LY-1074 TaxID=3074080 RepID=UPI002866422A|nr:MULTISPECIES: hypothetical protein [unclassified Agromyces]MDR5700342.1 hypothetical protein [Agromyces sp. LY-1074]MDR5706680.1 hypothetical protein [Agromyces sp. LY-1358]
MSSARSLLAYAGCAVAIVLAFTACSSIDLEGRFVRLAEDRGYGCHRTVPPADTADSIVTCRSDEGADLEFVVFSSQEARKRGEAQFLQVGDGKLQIGDGKSSGRWIISGSNRTDIGAIAAHLPD